MGIDTVKGIIKCSSKDVCKSLFKCVDRHGHYLGLPFRKKYIFNNNTSRLNRYQKGGFWVLLESFYSEDVKYLIFTISAKSLEGFGVFYGLNEHNIQESFKYCIENSNGALKETLRYKLLDADVLRADFFSYSLLRSDKDQTFQVFRDLLFVKGNKSKRQFPGTIYWSNKSSKTIIYDKYLELTAASPKVLNNLNLVEKTILSESLRFEYSLYTRRLLKKKFEKIPNNIDLKESNIYGGSSCVQFKQLLSQDIQMEFLYQSFCELYFPSYENKVVTGFSLEGIKHELESGNCLRQITSEAGAYEIVRNVFNEDWNLVKTFFKEVNSKNYSRSLSLLKSKFQKHYQRLHSKRLNDPQWYLENFYKQLSNNKEELMSLKEEVVCF